MIERVLLFDPLCRGFEHSVVNAALLSTVGHAFPSAKIVFASEQQHGSHVRKALELADKALGDRIAFEPIEPPPRQLGEWDRLPGEKLTVDRLARLAEQYNSDMILICSLTGPFLLQLKLALWRGAIPRPILAVMHAILNSLGANWTRGILNRIASFPTALRMPAPGRLRCLSLNDGITREWRKRSPLTARRSFTLDLPYFMKPVEAPAISERPPVVRFCYLGGGYKFFPAFLNLAQELHAPATTDFTIAGFVSSEADMAMARGFVSGLGTEPLDPGEMSARIRACTYAIVMCNPRFNRMTASASLLDAIAHGKPGIYVRTPFIESWFERLGDIGYLCANAGEMRGVIAGIQREFPSGRYSRQVENILKGRDALEPRNVAHQLSSIMEHWRREA